MEPVFLTLYGKAGLINILFFLIVKHDELYPISGECSAISKEWDAVNITYSAETYIL